MRDHPSCLGKKITTRAAVISVHETDQAIPSGADGGALAALDRFRQGFYDCLTRRADTLFELADAVLCAPGPVTSLVELSLAGEHRRGHGSLYDSVNAGRVEVDRLHNLVACQQIPRDIDGRIVLAVDVSAWLRPGADTSPERAFCHTYTRGGGKQMIPGWPYSFVAALEPGRGSWTALLHVRRLTPEDDDTAVSAAQLRTVVTGLITAGRWRAGDPSIWILADSGYHGTRLAVLLADLPVRLVVRMRANRVLRFPAPPRTPGQIGCPPRHGQRFRFDDVTTWPPPAHRATTVTRRYGDALAQCWHGLHATLTRRDGWGGHTGRLPVVAGTVIRVRVDRLPGRTGPTPMWLWCSDPGLDAATMDRAWQLFLRRFDLEHTFRFIKQALGWTRPRLRDPVAADRWTWLVLAAYTQLRLARPVVEDQRRAWERKPPAEPDRLSPVRVRRGFRCVRARMAVPARAPKPSRPGPGRPPGTRDTRRARRYTPGKKAVAVTRKAAKRKKS